MTTTTKEVSPVEKFEAAARKVERMIPKVATGEVDQQTGRKAIDRLYNLANKTLGMVGQDARLDRISALNKARIAADEAACEARQAERNKEIARLTAEHRDNMRSMSTHDREMYLLANR